MSVDDRFRTLGSDPGGTSTTQTPPLLDERLAWWCYVALTVLSGSAMALIVVFSLRANSYDPLLPVVAVSFGLSVWAFSRCRLVLRPRTLGRGRRGFVDLTALVAGGYSFAVPPAPVRTTKGTWIVPQRQWIVSSVRKVWLQDAERRQICFVPRRYRTGKVFAAAVAFAVQATSSLTAESAPSRLGRFRNDELLPADWRAEFVRSLAAHTPSVGGGWSSVPPPPPSQFLPPRSSTASGPFGKRRMVRVVIVTVVASVVTYVPLATGVGPRMVHNYYCGRNRHLWTTGANVPFDGPLWNAEKVDLPGLAMASHDGVVAGDTYADPKPVAVERTVWQGPDERVTVEQQHFDTRSDALLHHRNALEDACRSGTQMHAFDSVPGAVRVVCTCQKSRFDPPRPPRVQVVQGTERFLITIETPVGSPSAEMVAASTKRVLDSGRS